MTAPFARNLARCAPSLGAFSTTQSPVCPSAPPGRHRWRAATRRRWAPSSARPATLLPVGLARAAARRGAPSRPPRRQPRVRRNPSGNPSSTRMPSTFCRSAALRSFIVRVVAADTSHVMPGTWQFWMYGHAHHPYPSREEKEMLADVTDLTTVICATPTVARTCTAGELQRVRTIFSSSRMHSLQPILLTAAPIPRSVLRRSRSRPGSTTPGSGSCTSALPQSI